MRVENTEYAHEVTSFLVLAHRLGREGQIEGSFVYILDIDKEHWRDGEGVGQELSTRNLRENIQACQDYEDPTDSSYTVLNEL